MPSEMKTTVYQMFERKIGDRILVISNHNLGFEGILSTVSREPPGIWLSEAEVVTLRSTIVDPMPQIVTRIDKSELFIHLDSVLRIEVLHKDGEDVQSKGI